MHRTRPHQRECLPRVRNSQTAGEGRPSSGRMLGLRPPLESLKGAGTGLLSAWPGAPQGAAVLWALEPIGQQTPGGEFIRHSAPTWAPGDRNLLQVQCPWAAALPPSPSPLLTPQNELIWIWGPISPT